AADGISAGMAYGTGKGPPAPTRNRYRGSGRTRRLRIGEHVQHSLQPLRRPAARPICSQLGEPEAGRFLVLVPHPKKNLCEIDKFGMARPKRFELLTPRFVVWCSIQLSYGRAGTVLRSRRSQRSRLAAG